MNRSAQERKVKEGLTDPSDGGLGDTLRYWNENYFHDRGLFVSLELSESALKNPGQKSKALRKGAFLYSKREDRERKREERKFVIVVTRLDEAGQAVEDLKEDDAAERSPVEIGSSDEPAKIAELDADFGLNPVELPSGLSPNRQKDVPAPSGYFELDNDNTLLLERMHLEQGTGRSSMESEEGIMAQSSAKDLT